MEIIKVLKKNYPVFVRPVRVGDLDRGKLPPKFLSHNISDDAIVNVKCFEDGTLDLRGKKGEYRIVRPHNEMYSLEEAKKFAIDHFDARSLRSKFPNGGMVKIDDLLKVLEVGVECGYKFGRKSVSSKIS